MFERFHQNARAAVVHARDEATRSGKREIGTEHLLLGLLARPGHAADALTAAGADAAGLRARIRRGNAAQPGPLVAEPLVAEPLDAEPLDAEPLVAEPLDAEPLDAEPLDAEPLDAEPLDAGALVAESLDANALASVGIDQDAAQHASDATFGAAAPGRVRTPRGGRDVIGDMRLTRDARRALELALRAAQRLKHQHVSTGHVLLGIIDQPGTPAVEELTVAGINVGTLRTDVLRRMAARPGQAAGSDAGQA